MNIGFSAFVMQDERSGVASYIRGLIRTLQVEGSNNTYMLPTREDHLIDLNAPNSKKTLCPNGIANPIVNITYRAVIHNGLYRGLKEGCRG